MSDTKDSGIDFVRREYRDAYLAIQAEALEKAAQIVDQNVKSMGGLVYGPGIIAAIRALKDKP